MTAVRIQYCSCVVRDSENGHQRPHQRRSDRCRAAAWQRGEVAPQRHARSAQFLAVPAGRWGRFILLPAVRQALRNSVKARSSTAGTPVGTVDPPVGDGRAPSGNRRSPSGGRSRPPWEPSIPQWGRSRPPWEPSIPQWGRSRPPWELSIPQWGTVASQPVAQQLPPVSGGVAHLEILHRPAPLALTRYAAPAVQDDR
jgi:hypothetical protein